MDDAADEVDDEEISFEDLGAAYARAAADNGDLVQDHLTDPDVASSRSEFSGQLDSADDGLNLDDPDADQIERIPTALSIVEAALFVGHPDNQPITATRIASLMRDVAPEDVQDLIAELNSSYRDNRQSLRIVAEETGYRMTLSPEMESMRLAFVGKVREARLNQVSIEVLSLVAYQPGITAAKVTDQRGRDSGSILNQLVRRQLLMIERVKSDGGKATVHYYPSERFLYLFGLESLQDLPLVDEGLS